MTKLKKKKKKKKRHKDFKKKKKKKREVCETKFLQHCSTNKELREAASEAAKKFTKMR